ncbi:MAG TPA: RpiB/LacA/LacB family sugar-phosphate isomerase [Candidatus Paceibacterota bacterium]
MLIYLGSDHRGFKLKEFIKTYLKDNGYQIHDVGNVKYDPADDYPDFAKAVAENVAADPDGRRGVVFCGSGVGVDIVANKFDRVRSVLANTPDQVMVSRVDDDTNVLSVAADFINPEDAKRMIAIWLQTPFSKEERHKRRLDKIGEIEKNN